MFSLFKFFGWKNILNQLENSGLKSRFLFCLIFQFYLMYRLICQKPAHFLSAQKMALVSTFFQMFIVLGMYNFANMLIKAKIKYWQPQKWHSLTYFTHLQFYKSHIPKLAENAFIYFLAAAPNWVAVHSRIGLQTHCCINLTICSKTL